MKESKQNKVLNKIHRDHGQSVDTLKAAQKAKDDEFYTPLVDITKELDNWKDKIAGKNIYCPCDWDILAEDPDVVGIHVEMDINRSERDIKFGIHRISKCYIIRYKGEEFKNVRGSFELVKKYENEEISKLDFFHKLFNCDIEEDRIKDLICEEVDPNTARRVTCNFIKYLLTTDCKSITATGYDVVNDRGVKFQEVNYDPYDIIITNPPFSCYSEFMDTVLKSGKDFIILAPFTNRANPNVGLPLMLKKCYLGYNRGIHINFQNPDRDHGYKSKKVLVDWLTTFSDAQDEVDNSRMSNNIHFYDSSDSVSYGDEYYEMENMTMKDGSHPRKMANSSIIPDDYTGWIFTTIGSLNKLSTQEFEWYGTAFAKYFNSDNRQANPFNHKAHCGSMYVHNGKSDFAGIVCRRRTPENGNMEDIFKKC